MLDFNRFTVLTFDCYGTLIDWETGLLAALRPVLEAHGVALTDGEVLALYAELETKEEAGEYRRYRAVLREIVVRMGQRLGFTPSEAEQESLPESLPSWPPFPDTVEALRALKARYRLAVVSNTDDDLFAGTAPSLVVVFDEVITAEQVGSYKPSHRNFEAAIERVGAPKGEILHVAQSLYHDIVPAKALGLSAAWVNRRKGREGGGATPPANALPDVEVPDLRSLVELMGIRAEEGRE
jgi:2-haloacid dehalogenase